MASDVKKQIKNGQRDKRGVRIANYKPSKRMKQNQEELNELNIKTLEVMIADFLPKLAKPLPKYDTVEQLQDAITNYFIYIADCNQKGAKLIPDVEGLCSFIGVPRRTLLFWETENKNNFAPTISQTKNFIAAYKKQLGFNGEIPPIIFATDFNNNHDYVNPKNQIEITARPVETIDKEALIREALSMPTERLQIAETKKDPTD